MICRLQSEKIGVEVDGEDLDDKLCLTVTEDRGSEWWLAWFSVSTGRSVISEAGRSCSTEITNLLEVLIN